MSNVLKNIPVNLTKEFEFEACHRLVGYNGPCERYHGHSYKLEVTVQGVPKGRNGCGGLLVDFKELKDLVKEEVIDIVDHEDLNVVMHQMFNMTPTQNTTCENMIIAFWYALDHTISEKFEGVTLNKLKLYETRTSCATLTRCMVYGG
jgi:6-pyruvoyl-tetrahydropterin synthase